MSSDAPSAPDATEHDPDPTNVRGRRIGAVFIDAAVLAIPSILILAWALEKRTDVTSCDQIQASLKTCLLLGDDVYAATDDRVIGWQLLSALLAVTYYVILQGFTGWTVGKRLVGIRVVDADGTICGIPRGFIRYLPLFIPALIPGVGPILGFLVGITEFVLILAHRRHQRMGDLFARTFVVRQSAVGRPVPAG